MIVDALFHAVTRVAIEVASHVATDATKELVRAFWPRRSRGGSRPASRLEARPGPPPVIVGAGAMFDRLALYDAWAAAHGLEPTAQRGAELAGSYRGRRIEMNTGLCNTSLPRSPELLLRVAVPGVRGSVLLEPGAETPSGGPALGALAALLAVEGVRDIGVTAAFVRLRFDAFVETAAFDRALDAFEIVFPFAPLSESALAAPYR